MRDIRSSEESLQDSRYKPQDTIKRQLLLEIKMHNHGSIIGISNKKGKEIEFYERKEKSSKE